MNKYQKKILAALSTGTLLLSAVTPAFAATKSFVISGNGSGSDSDIEYEQESEVEVNQNNFANVTNNVSADSDSGDNEANDNTGGDVSIDTGDAITRVEISNLLNSNSFTFDCCLGEGDTEVLISGNGSDTENDVDLETENEVEVDQYNDADVENTVDADADSGDNEAEDNTGGDVEIITGDAGAAVKLLTMANKNSAWVGGDNGGSSDLSAKILGNGSDSENDIDLDIENELDLDQDNYADVNNDVNADADSGDNDAEDNTSGEVSIDTGDAFAGVKVDNLLNWNWADFPCDCLLGDIEAKISGNGSDSENEIEAELEEEVEVDQYNDADVENDADADADSGDNEAEDNGGSVNGDPSIETGDAESLVKINNTGDANVYGSADEDWPWNDVEVNVSVNLSDFLSYLASMGL